MKQILEKKLIEQNSFSNITKKNKILLMYEKYKTRFKQLPKSQKVTYIASVIVIIGVFVVTTLSFFTKQKLQDGHGAAGEGFEDMLNSIQEETVNQQAVINCLNDKGVTLYLGASCGFTKEEVMKKGKIMKEFAIVDCDVDGELCDMAGVKELPSRCANGRCVGDIFSLKDLAVEFDCNK